MPYEKFSRFYDLVMGDRSEAANFTRSLIERHKPESKTILEIACGTGAILGFLADTYDVTGLDRSRQMLALARKKLPHIRFYRQGISSFRIAKQFDAIVCVFDSINHLLSFGEWKKVFRRVALHLNDDGLFVFDVNTLGKLRRLTIGPVWLRQFDRDLVIIKVTGGRRGIFDWDVKIFEHQKRDAYKLSHETISELALPHKPVLTALRDHFKQIKVIDPGGARPSDQSERLYFVCKK
ncbi:MAG: class I SAM-dependent DNA methyltransferase [Candidatus Binatia bacterium]